QFAAEPDPARIRSTRSANPGPRRQRILALNCLKSGPSSTCQKNPVITVYVEGELTGSVVPTKTCIFSSMLVPNAPGTVAAATPPLICNGAITFTTDQTVDQLLWFEPGAVFYLTLIGTNRGQEAVTDQMRVPLDGDYDGVPGGDW